MCKYGDGGRAAWRTVENAMREETGEGDCSDEAKMAHVAVQAFTKCYGFFRRV
jgi:hypothetical protein